MTVRSANRLLPAVRQQLSTVLACALLAVTLLPASPALAHHGWRWTADGTFEVVGVIETATLGNPHGVLILDVDGEKWTAEVGQPWRNERAGLTDAMLVKGAEITVRGKRSANEEDKVVKAERVFIKGVLHDLYPDRQ